jgi:phosphate uptake regulator
MRDRERDIRHRFDDDLVAIRTGLVQMGSLVVENTKRAGEAVTENRLDLVDPVRRADEEINDLYKTLETRTFEILALQQPVATDLRFLIAHRRGFERKGRRRPRRYQSRRLALAGPPPASQSDPTASRAVRMSGVT